jgi:DNA polymerase V
MNNDFQPIIESDAVSVHSGFPNPAADRKLPALALDLNQLIVQHPSSTYLFRIAGHNWSDQGIFDGDIAVIDRGAIEGPNDLVVIWQNNDFKIARSKHLSPEEKPWGKVSAVIHQF